MKGSDFEWTIAKQLSKWLTGGIDKTQLVRSIQSGGSARLKISAARPEYQVGDLAPNGPRGEEFRRRWAVECKAYHLYPEWWYIFGKKEWDNSVGGWWAKLNRECLPYALGPMLIMKRDRQPVVVAVGEWEQGRISLSWPRILFPTVGIVVFQLSDLLASDPQTWLVDI